MTEQKPLIQSHDKHPLWIRWTHWVNFPILSLMVWSGILIYWSNDVYKPFFPSKFYEIFGIDHRLADGMAIHFVLMWIFLLNGIAYVGYLAYSGEWREILPEKGSIQEAFQVLLHDFGIIKTAPPQGKFNAAQRIAYTSITIIGLFSILTGLAIYKPVQLHAITSIFGGYESARLIHFILMIAVVLFFITHVMQVARAGLDNFSLMLTGKKGTSIIMAISLAIIAIAGWNIVSRNKTEEDIAPVLRKGLDANARLWRAFFNPNRVAPMPVPPLNGSWAAKTPRFNGDVGLNEDYDLTSWKLHLIPVIDTGDTGAKNSVSEIVLDQKDFQKFPRTTTSAQFKCIEGWSDDISYSGVKFSEFMDLLHVGRKSDGSLYRYVGLVTPDGEYYVSIDTKSMLQSQVLLADEMDGKPLSLANGAPLRLIIPNKYGIKSLKRIGKIFFSDQRPPDYWNERGYDWFSGL